MPKMDPTQHNPLLINPIIFLLQPPPSPVVLIRSNLIKLKLKSKHNTIDNS